MKEPHTDRKFTNRAENPLLHDTWKLLSRYRDVTWSLELSVQQMKKSFEIEYGTSIDEFLDSVYLAGAELTGTNIEYQAKCIERSNKMLKLVDSSIDLLRNKHKNGETFYWVLYYTYLSPQEVGSVLDIIEAIRPHVKYISYRTYYRYRREAIEALSNVLWGYTSRDCMDLLEKFFPDKQTAK